MGRLYSRAAFIIATIGMGLLAAAAISMIAGGFALSLGPLRFSAKDPSRLVTQGTIALLISAALGLPDRPCSRRIACLTTALLAGFYLSLVADSRPRRVGDGHEYLAMARQMSTGRPPALSAADLVRVSSEMERLGSGWSVDLAAPHLTGSDGRQDFPHFWLYSAFVAPIVAVFALSGLHWNHAFTVFNIALLTTAACVALRRVRPAATPMLVAGPIVWWLDKASVEVFTFGLLAIAASLWSTAPCAAVVLLGVLTAQNPAFGLTLVAVGVWATGRARPPDRRRIVLALAVAAAIGVLHPLYYFWHLRRPSPLASSLVLEWPGITAVLTPLLDPLAGVAWCFPGLVALVALVSACEIRDRRIVPLMALAGLVGALLVVFALSSNVNHGGTPGPSRYGIWLAPLVLTLFAHRPDGTPPCRHGRYLPLVAMLSLPHAVWMFHPKLPENSEAPTRVGNWFVERTPALYNPLPEVFAERFGGNDGDPLVPTASARCEKVLLSGEGSPAMRWPIPCAPAPVPAACTQADVLCYANRSGGAYEFVSPPRQPGFRFVVAAETSWRGPRDFDWLPVPVGWERLTVIPAFTKASAIREGTNLRRIRALEGDAELVAFVAPVSLAPARLRVRPLAAPSDLWWLGLTTRRVLSSARVSGEVWSDVPSGGEMVLLIIHPAAASEAGR